MKNQVFHFENPFRSVYEVYAVFGWLGAGLMAFLFRDALHMEGYVLTGFLIVCAVGAIVRGRKLRSMWRFRGRLTGQKLSFINRKKLRKELQGHEKEVFLGYGYPWGHAEVQLCHTIARTDTARFNARRDSTQMGQPWIHGIGQDKEKQIYVPLDHLAGHTLLVGTTRSGKTRILDILITQAVNRGECVIVWDPKGDEDLCNAARNACIDNGRAADFNYFHPAFPEKCVRIDPLKNFNRASELATRIAALIPSETGSDPFTAHSMMVLNNLCEGLLMINMKPTLKLLKRFVDAGPEWLLIRAYEAHFEKHIDEWRSRAEGYVAKAKKGARGKDNRMLAIAYEAFYQDVVVANAPSGVLESLFADFTHDQQHQQKMTASLTPVLTMLTSGSIGDLLSPDPDDLDDRRPITDFARIIRNNQVCYVGLDTLSDNMVGSAIGSMFLSDMTAVSGDRYNYGDGREVPEGESRLRNLNPVTIVIDEAAEVVSDKMIQLLNKAGGSSIRLIIATQTFADFAARIGSETKARMVLGNLNNKIVLRTIDGDTQEYISESFPKTYVRHLEYSRATRASSDKLHEFNSSMSESMKETEVSYLEPAVLGCLPSLEFFAQVSGGHVIKGRIPILKDDAPQKEESKKRAA